MTKSTPQTLALSMWWNDGSRLQPVLSPTTCTTFNTMVAFATNQLHAFVSTQGNTWHPTRMRTEGD
eukprot:m.886281 g.886281  ORF g.886281 m.886281 type:complete len:66 (+) comp23624_c0_seq20:1745-1942(+)